MKLSEGLTADQKCCVVAKKTNPYSSHNLIIFCAQSGFSHVKGRKNILDQKMHFIFTYKYDGICLSFNFRKLMT